METAEFAPATVHGQGNKYSVSHGGDEGLLVQFYNESELQRHESEKAGRPIYKDRPYLWIRFPGDRTREVKRRVDLRGKNGAPPDPERFPRQWAAFQRQESQEVEGTPLEQWAPMSRSLALTYKGLSIHTVEQLSAVPDSALTHMGHGARDLRDKAIAWLKQAEDGAEVTKLASENQHLKDEIAALKSQVAEIATKRKPGRPKKTADE